MKIKVSTNFIRAVVAIVIALTIAIGIILLVSREPGNAISKFLFGPLLSPRYFGDVIELVTPLLFTGLAVSIMFQANVFNLATEGVFYSGGMTAALIACTVSMPAGLHPLTALIVASVVGGMIAFIPAYLKVRFSANEVVSSLMLNYVVFKLGDYLLKTYIKDPKVTHLASYKYPQTAVLPKLAGDVHIGLIIALMLLILAYIFMYKTKWGYAIRITGQNADFAKYSGIGVAGTILLSQIIGGMIAGLGGAAHILGATQRFTFEWRSGYGWDGLIVAIIARYNAKLIPIGAFILAYFRIGTDIMSRQTDVQNEVVAIIQGVIIILMVSAGFLEKWNQRRIFKSATAEREGS